MSTNAFTNGSETAANKFYVPAATSAGNESRIERFMTALYEKHSLFTRRLE